MNNKGGYLLQPSIKDLIKSPTMKFVFVINEIYFKRY